ncbi:hypothetical protein QZH41_019768, partial [Actinostola sp. cb2023]
MKIPKPNIFNARTEYKAFLGTSYNLTCKVHWPGFGLKDAAFWRRGKRVKDDSRHERLDQRRTNYVIMAITNVSMEDEGAWECRAYYRAVSQDNKVFRLEIAACPAGHYCPRNESEPRPCGPGTYNDGATNVTYRCKDCPYSSLSNQSLNTVGSKSLNDCVIWTPRSGTPKS